MQETHEQPTEREIGMIRLLTSGIRTVLVAAAMAAAVPMIAFAQTAEPAIESAPAAAKPAAANASPTGDANGTDKGSSVQTKMPAKPAIHAAGEVDTQRRFNELRRELLDDRADTIDWWLEATAIFLTLLGIGAVLAGYLSFKRFREIEAEARSFVEEIKAKRDEAESLVEKEIKAKRDEAESLVEKLSAETVGKDPDEAGRAAESVRSNPFASLINQAVADAVLFQRRGEIEKAVKKWRAVADVAEESDTDLAVRAWVSVGYLSLDKSPEDGIAANDRAIRLKPDYVAAYLNRGVAKAALGQHNDAISDYDEAIRLNPDYVAAYVNRGNEKTVLGQHNDAIADYDRAIHLEPDNAVAYINRGRAKAGLGLKAEGRKDFETALELARNAGNANMVAHAEQSIRDPGSTPTFPPKR